MDGWSACVVWVGVCWLFGWLQGWFVCWCAGWLVGGAIPGCSLLAWFVGWLLGEFALACECCVGLLDVLRWCVLLG